MKIKIKFVLKENQRDTINLPPNPYNMKIINFASPNYVKKYQKIEYGWLFPDGTSSDFDNADMMHGEIMQYVNPEYADDDVELRGPFDFGNLTGSIRITYGLRFGIEIFTKLSREQLVWIRRNILGEELLISLSASFNSHKLIEIKAQSDGYWLQELNKELLNNNLVDFDPLKESKMFFDYD